MKIFVSNHNQPYTISALFRHLFFFHTTPFCVLFGLLTREMKKTTHHQAFSLIVLRHTFIQPHAMNNRKIKSTQFQWWLLILFFSLCLYVTLGPRVESGYLPRLPNKSKRRYAIGSAHFFDCLCVVQGFILSVRFTLWTKKQLDNYLPVFFSSLIHALHKYILTETNIHVVVLKNIFIAHLNPF